jgi:hypothetical protein
MTIGWLELSPFRVLDVECNGLEERDFACV